MRKYYIAASFILISFLISAQIAVPVSPFITGGFGINLSTSKEKLQVGFDHSEIGFKFGKLLTGKYSDNAFAFQLKLYPNTKSRAYFIPVLRIKVYNIKDNKPEEENSIKRKITGESASFGIKIGNQYSVFHDLYIDVSLGAAFKYSTNSAPIAAVIPGLKTGFLPIAQVAIGYNYIKDESEAINWNKNALIGFEEAVDIIRILKTYNFLKSRSIYEHLYNPRVTRAIKKFQKTMHHKVQNGHLDDITRKEIIEYHLKTSF